MQIEQIIQQAIDYVAQFEKIPSRQKIAEALGIPEGTAKQVRFLLEHADKVNPKVFDDIKTEETLENNTRTITTISTKVRTEEEAIEFHKIDLKKWYVKQFKCKAWTVTMGLKQSGTGQPETYTNYGTTLTLERLNPNQLTVEEQAEQFKEFTKWYKPSWTKLEKLKRFDSNFLLEISIYDFHYGLLSWHRETGTNYDVKIASALWIETIKYFAEIAKKNKVKRILFPLGNDFFNVNDAMNTTFRGTPQDEDCRYQKTFVTGWMLLVQGVNILLKVAPVDVVIVPGNHDQERVFYAGEVIKTYYKDCKDVTIDNRPLLRKYYNFGKNLIGLTHGDKEKIQDLPALMFLEARDLAKNCDNFEFHLGHLHHERGFVKEYVDQQSVKVRYMPSISANSAYSKSKGYLSTRKSIAVLWDENNGVEADFYYYPKKEVE